MNVQFRIEGSNRVGSHERFEHDYAAAYKLRGEGKFREAIALLRETLKQPLSLYALTAVAFEFSRSFQELGELDVALYHIRRATLDSGELLDKGLRRAALARRIELEALTHNYWRAVCAYELYNENYDLAELEPPIKELALKARTTLLGNTAIATEVKMVDRDRKDTENFWSRRLIRPWIRVQAMAGQVAKAQMICALDVIDLPVAPVVEFRDDRSRGFCDIYIFAAPDSKFQVSEGT